LRGSPALGGRGRLLSQRCTASAACAPVLGQPLLTKRGLQTFQIEAGQVQSQGFMAVSGGCRGHLAQTEGRRADLAGI